MSLAHHHDRETALGIDVGGTTIKAGVVDVGSGDLVGSRVTEPTPTPASPAAVQEVLQRAVAAFDWDGPVGYIHQVAYDQYLQNHPDPDEIEYYICGPPVMLEAVQKMLDSLGVEPEMIAFDDFGG